MADPAYVKLQDPFTSSKNSKQKSFCLENPRFLIPRNPVLFKEPCLFSKGGSEMERVCRCCWPPVRRWGWVFGFRWPPVWFEGWGFCELGTDGYIHIYPTKEPKSGPVCSFWGERDFQKSPWFPSSSQRVPKCIWPNMFSIASGFYDPKWFAQSSTHMNIN